MKEKKKNEKKARVNTHNTYEILQRANTLYCSTTHAELTLTDPRHPWKNVVHLLLPGTAWYLPLRMGPAEAPCLSVGQFAGSVQSVWRFRYYERILVRLSREDSHFVIKIDLFRSKVYATSKSKNKIPNREYFCVSLKNRNNLFVSSLLWTWFHYLLGTSRIIIQNITKHVSESFVHIILILYN